MRRFLIVAALFVVVSLGGPLLTVATGAVDPGRNWRAASREPAELAPDPRSHGAAVVQIYSARAVSWRGAFGVHSWIAIKDTDAVDYEVFEVIGWRARWGRPVLAINARAPDSRWFGTVPEVLVDLRGEWAEKLIEPIREAVERYPYPHRYRVWPGPNSNTFVAWVAREVPGLGVDLPPTAIGKDYLPGTVFAEAPSGTGYQISLFGLLGLTLAVDEGIELNLLGATIGVDILSPALKLPGLGRLGAG
jgi:hypothetical protein